MRWLLPTLLIAFTGTFFSCATFENSGSKSRSLAADDSQPNVQPSSNLCPSYAPSSGPQACDPVEIAKEINAFPHAINWTGTADPAWTSQHSACTTSESFSQLGQDLEGYSNPNLGYWAEGDFSNMRANSSGFWDQRSKMVQDYFNKEINDPEIQKICCQGNSDCLNKFLQTKLVFSDQDSGIGDYDSIAHAITFGKNALLMEIYDEPIQQIVLHELGHSCDDSIYYSENPSNPTQLTGTQPIEQESAHISSRLGFDYLACLQTHALTENNHVALDTRNADEAFAQAIFSSRYNQSLDWTGLVVPSNGYSWGLECVLQLPRFKSQACGK